MMDDKNTPTTPQDRFIQQVTDMGQEILALYHAKTQIPFQESTELERQIIAAYLFGMANGLLMDRQLGCTPEQVEPSMIIVLCNVFSYARHQAAAFINDMIASLQSKDEANTLYVIIHRGLDGYFAFQAGEKQPVIQDVTAIIETLRQHS